MVKTGWVASAVRTGLTLGVCLLGLGSSAWGVSTSDKPAAILVWPKIVVDTSGVFGNPTDTVLQLSNTDSAILKQAHCFYVNANSHCGATANEPGKVCQTSSDCPSGSGLAACVPGWNEIDFDIRVTPEQPLGWLASKGLKRGEFPLEVAGTCSNAPNVACVPNGFPNICGSGTCVGVPSNLGSGIPPSPEDPFVGSLKCIQFDPAVNPPAPDQSSTSNRLKGEATIEQIIATNTVDVQKYNAVGIQFKALESSVPAGELHLDGVQYEACPSTLILNHVFDGAVDPLTTNFSPTRTFTTDLTLVPCGDDFLRQQPGVVTAQFLVFNEFEQPFSTSKKVDCFLESQISLIDTSSPTRSIFSVGVSGTLTGQTRIRGVGTAATGHGLLGVARVSTADGGAAYNLHQTGNISGPDVITIP